MKTTVPSIRPNASFLPKKEETTRLAGECYRKTLRFLEENQVCDTVLWKRFANQFRHPVDGENGGWRGEYWGKMMRGACTVYAITRDPELYRILEDSVKDLLSTQDAAGRISSYTPETEFHSWDIWCRKYVLLGCEYFLEFCQDKELEKAVVEALKKHADYLLSKIGPEAGKLSILDTSTAWGAANSCSILEPMVKLYEITGGKRYFDFATYLVSTGFCRYGNLIAEALESPLPPHRFATDKAYEMMSCFEGLIEYYFVTGEEMCKNAAISFGRKILANELSIIGCSGCAGEQFDHTLTEQTKIGDEIMQETCVTVTWMKLAGRLLTLSEDPAFADSIEQSFYNAYRGALNTDLNTLPFRTSTTPTMLPFDSYSPLAASTRGKKVGGYQTLEGGTYYGCCACIGAAGIGPITQNAVTETEDGFAVNFYEAGKFTKLTPSGETVTFVIESDYPAEGKIKITLQSAKKLTCTLKFRIPGWCRDAKITLKGITQHPSAGYAAYESEWESGSEISVELPMKFEKLLPPAGAQNEKMFYALRRGPIVLAADARITDPDLRHPLKCEADGTPRGGERACCPEIPEAEFCYSFAEAANPPRTFRLIDYASAGKDYQSRIAAWIRK